MADGSSDSCDSCDHNRTLTQPIECGDDDEVTDSVTHPETPNTWAWLLKVNSSSDLPIVPSFLPVSSDVARVGRNPAICQLSLDGLGLDEQNFAAASQSHFTLYRGCNGRPYLVDTSSNGTWVNGEQVEPDERYRLSHNDAISVVKPGLVVFVFFHEGKMSKLYPDIFDKFLVGEEVGSGSFSVVYEGYKRFSMEKVAMKIIKKKRKSITTESGSDVILRTEDVFKEVDILKNLEHPCVNQLVDFIHSPTNTVIVLEFAAGGELFEQVCEDHDAHRMSEEVAKIQFYQISHAIAYLHASNICHRDLKTENILMMSKDARAHLKISDFGLSKKFSSTSMLETYAGTPNYMAPEVLDIVRRFEMSGDASDGGDGGPEFYTCLADCWSLGVLLYILLSGHKPFQDGSPSKILTGKYEEMEGGCWDGDKQGSRAEPVSDGAKELVRKLLVVDPQKRLSAEEILEDPWFANDAKTVIVALNIMGLNSFESPSFHVGGKRKAEDDPAVTDQSVYKRKTIGSIVT